MTLIKLPHHLVKTASASAPAPASASVSVADSTELAFSGTDAPSAKLSLNINAFNGNKTNFGGRNNK
jgi:hypothetical protein